MCKDLLLVAMVSMTAAQLFACAAVDKNGKKCTRNPSSGSQYCWLHGGTDKSAQAAGKTNVVKKAQGKAKTAADATGAAAEKKRVRKVEAETRASPKAR